MQWLCVSWQDVGTWIFLPCIVKQSVGMNKRNHITSCLAAFSVTFPPLVMFLTASLTRVLLFFVLVLSIIADVACAQDYRVDFRIETAAGREAGSASCSFDRLCESEAKSLGFRFNVELFRDSPERAYVHMYGDASCCFFAGAARSVTLDPGKPLLQVPFFKGRASNGDEWVENTYSGELYLIFNPRRNREENRNRNQNLKWSE
jgi:hypothetical protein